MLVSQEVPSITDGIDKSRECLNPVGDKASEQLDIIPMQIQVIPHVRKQYAFSCCEGYMKTAVKPKQPIEKSQASAVLLAYIAKS